MRLVIDNVSVEVSKKKVSPTLILPKLRAFIQNPDDGELVEVFKQRRYYLREGFEMLGTKDVVTYKDEYVHPETGNAIPFQELSFRIEKDGELVVATLYQGSKTITPMLTIPRSEVQNYKFESVYEVYPKNSAYNDREFFEITKKLYTKAEEWIAENKAGLGKWVHRSNSTIAWVLLLFPIIREVDNAFKFVWVMATDLETDTLVRYKQYEVPLRTDVDNANGSADNHCSCRAGSSTRKLHQRLKPQNINCLNSIFFWVKQKCQTILTSTRSVNAKRAVVKS